MLGESSLKDCAVGGSDRAPHPIGYLFVVETAQRLELPRYKADRHFTRDFPGGMPTHAVGDDKDAPVGHQDETILIPRPDDADIGAAS
jgi:hypothetical protein